MSHKLPRNYVKSDFTFQGGIDENISEVQKDDMRKEIEYTSNNSNRLLQTCNVTKAKNSRVYLLCENIY